MLVQILFSSDFVAGLLTNRVVLCRISPQETTFRSFSSLVSEALSLNLSVSSIVSAKFAGKIMVVSLQVVSLGQRWIERTTEVDTLPACFLENKYIVNSIFAS